MHFNLFAPAFLVSLSPLVASHAIGKRQGNIPFGSIITSCTKPGVVALTFDDGPASHTATVLDKLQAAGVKATFFINGNNYGYIYDYNSTVHRYIADGHQIGSHTWSHPHLPTLSTAGIISQMTQLEDALVNILGYFPYYMRAPFFDYGTNVLPVMQQLEYHVIDCNIDTLDWQYNTNATIGTAKQRYSDGLNAGGSISLSHDPQPYTGLELVDYMINAIKAAGLTSVPIGECIGDPAANWYRPARSVSPTVSSSVSTSKSTSVSSTNVSSSRVSTTTSSIQTGSSSSSSSGSVTGSSSTSSSALPTGTVSPDGTCGGTKGYICPSGQCCSKWGNCGTTNDFCVGQNCNPLYGTCKTTLPTGSPSPDSTCGGTNGYVCQSGQCCSSSGWCGTTTEYCGTGCQLSYGTCSASSSSSRSSSTLVSSTLVSSSSIVVSSSASSSTPAASSSSSSAPAVSSSASSSTPAVSSSASSSTPAVSSSASSSTPAVSSSASSSTPAVSSSASSSTPSVSASSSVAVSSSSRTSSAAQPSGTVSTDGTCGGTKGLICPSGQCCSKWGNCGTTNDFCVGRNCDAAFGTCKANLPAGSTTPDGTCGGTIGYVCSSTGTDKCCSKSGWCGSTTAYCGTGCQSAFGTCT